MNYQIISAVIGAFFESKAIIKIKARTSDPNQR